MTDLSVWWIRRDLRLHDNPALHSALQSAQDVLPLFILDPALLESQYVGDKRLAFLFSNLHQLDSDLREIGGRLHVRSGSPTEVLPAILKETDGGRVFAERDHSPYAIRRDRAVGENVPLELTGSPAIRSPGTVLKQDGDPYRMFTAFRDRWRSQPLPTQPELLPKPERIDVPELDSSEPLPEAPQASSSDQFPPGEQAARTRLRAFASTDGDLQRYAQTRDRLDLESTSMLSPYLRFGLISARTAFVQAHRTLNSGAEIDTESVQRWLDELIWRDFYLQILEHFPDARTRSFRPAYRSLAWRNNPDEFEAWQTGQTGYPIVDAAMRQLKSTGWMHNRARMIVASFLTKHLLIDWRWGERHFMQHLLDGDPASNNGGWQWAAATGTDAAPYFRIFNPITQSEKHDPEGKFIRRWVHELTHVPDDFIHAPWRMSDEAQRKSNCVIGTDYPAPIVDHSHGRERALERYQEAREIHQQDQEEGKTT